MADTHTEGPRFRRQLRSFLLAVVVAVAFVLSGPFILHFVFGFPVFPLRARLSAGADIFALIMPVNWVMFTRRSDFTARIAVVALSMIVIVSLSIAWRYH